MKIVKILLAIILLILLGILIRQNYLVIKNKQKINREIAQLKAEAQKYTRQNEELKKMIDYFSSPEFQEKEIKEKLNVVEEGEKVIIVQPLPRVEKQRQLKQEKEIVRKRANYYWWWHYFFGERE